MTFPPRARTFAAVLALGLGSAVVSGVPAGAQAPSTESVRAVVSQASMNVYRRFVPEHRDKMVEFYDKVLTLRALQPITLGGGNQMILFGIGTGQIKLATGLKEGRKYQPGRGERGHGHPDDCVVLPG